MYKRILFLLSLVVIVLIVVLLIYRRGGQDQKQIRAADVVSDDAIFFLDNIDYNYFSKEFSNNNAFWNEIVNSDFDFFPEQRLKFYKQLINKLLDTKDSRNKNEFGISLHLVGKNEYHQYFI